MQSHPGARKSTLIFCVNVAHVQALTQTFRSYGVDARYVYSKTPVAERKALISLFKAGQFPVLLNCGQLKLFQLTTSTVSHSNQRS
jgi:ATP-dependent helicase IRC3